MATLTIRSIAGQILATHRLDAPLVIRAQDQVQYLLADDSGRAANAIAERAGNDLLVNVDGEALLRIEDYFLLDDSGLSNPLLGMNASGQYVAYPVADAALPVEHVLASEVATASAGSLNPAIALAALGGVALTGAAIAGSSKGDDSKTDTPSQPQTPLDPNQPTPPPADNGNVTPPPGGGGNTNPPPSGGGNNPPPTTPTPNASIAISGDAEVGKTLTAQIIDPDGTPANPQYQWFANGQPIQGATQSSYTLTAAEKDARITVQAIYTDAKNTAEAPLSAATDPVVDSAAPDTTPPTLIISAVPPSLALGATAELTFKTSEAVKDFTVDDILVQGGTLSDFKQINDTTFTATFTAGAAGNASIRVADDVFTDTSGNPNESAMLDLVISAAPNTAPQSADGMATLNEDASHTFAAAHFAFSDADGHALRAVRIDTLPEKGTLTLNGAAVSAGQIVPAGELGQLIYRPAENGNGKGYARFTFSVQDSEGAFAAAPSTFTFDVAQVNDAPSGTVSIIGRFEAGQQLDASHDLEDIDGLGAITFRWLADGVEVGTGTRYTLTDNDVGKRITLRAEYTDGDGNPEQKDSAPSEEILPAANEPPTDLTLSADRLPENTPGAVIGELRVTDPDANDSHTFTVSDPRFEVVNGQLKLKDGESVDFANEPRINLHITVTDRSGESYQSDFLIEVVDDPNYPAPAAPNGTVVIEGEARVGQTLSAQVEDADGVDEAAIEYQWYANDLPIANAIGKTYTLTAADKDARITVRASYIDQADQDEAPLSAATAPVVDAQAPGNQAPTDILLTNDTVPENQASAVVGRLTTVDPDSSAHTYSVDDPRFQISADGTLALKAGERVEYEKEQTITLKITSDDGDNRFTKDFTIRVGDDPNYPAPPSSANQPGSVKIEGEARAGQLLTAVIQDADGVPTSGVSYQWYRSNQKIDGATNAAYALENRDIGHKITVVVQYQDNAGFPESHADVTPYIQRATGDNAIGTVTIRGEVKVGQTLTAVITDADGVPDAQYVQYQWRALRPGAPSFEDIAGANGQTYTVDPADLDTAFQVIVKYTDLKGFREHLGSTASIRAIAADAVAQPLIEHGNYELRGSFSVIPQPDAESAWVRYTDEQDVQHTVRWHKENGLWRVESALPENTTLNAQTGAFFVPADGAKDLQHAFAANTIGGVESSGVRFYPYIDAVGNQVPHEPVITHDNYHSDYGSGIGGLSVKPGENTEVLTLRYFDENGAPKTLTISRAQYSVAWSIEPELASDSGISFNSENGTLHFEPNTLKDGSELTAISQNRISDISHTSTHAVPYDVPGKPLFEKGDPANPGLPEHGAFRVTPGADTDKLSVNYDAEDGSRQTLVIEKRGDAWQAESALPTTIALNAQTGALTFSAAAIKDYSQFNTTSANAHTPYTTGDYAYAGAALTQPNPPKLASGSLEGSVVITPDMTGAQSTVEMVVRYTDENGAQKTLYTYSSYLDGWVFAETSYGTALANGTGGVYIDSQSGVLTLSPDAVRDGSQVHAQAIGHSWKDYPAEAQPFTAGNDNPNPPPQLSLAGAERIAEGQSGDYTVRLSQAATEDVSVDIRLTAPDGEEALFTPSVQRVTIAAGETSASFSVAVADDGKNARRADFQVALANPQGAALGFDASVNTHVADTTPTPPDLPTITQGLELGSMRIVPAWNADRLNVRYTDEQGQEQRLSASKNADGEWTIDGTPPPHVQAGDYYGSFALELGAQAVRDGSDIYASNTSASGLSSGETSGQAGHDRYDPAEHPNAQADEARTAIGQSVDIDVLANDTDPQGNHTIDRASLTLHQYQQSGQRIDARDGVWEIIDGKVRFTPKDGQPEYSPAPVYYTVVDHNGNRSENTEIRVKYHFPPASVTLSGDNTVDEGRHATYRLELDRPTEEPIDVVLKISYLGGSERKDLILHSDTWTETILAGNKGQSFYLNALRDTIADSGESYRVEILSVGSNAKIGSENSVTTQIIDVTTAVDAARAPEPAAIALSGNHITVTPGGQTNALNLYYTKANGETQNYVLGQYNGQWDDWAPDGIQIGQNGQLSIPADLLKKGSDLVAIAVHHHDDGRLEAQTIAHLDAQGHIQLRAADNAHLERDDILLAPGSEKDLAALLGNLNADQLPQWLDAETPRLLAQSDPDARHHLDGGAGNDLLISLNGADRLEGGAGHDEFIFIADQHASLKADHILDFHAGEDLIRLIGGERHIARDNIHFDESSQTLSYHSQGEDGSNHTHHIRIDSHNGLKLLEDDVLQNLHIL